MKAGDICSSKSQKCSSRMRKNTVSADEKNPQKPEFQSLPTHFSSMPSIVKVSDTEYDTGRFITQDDKKFPILFKVGFDKNTLDIKIPVPHGYKKTELTTKIKLFGRLVISTDELYVNILYIYTQVFARISTRYEKAAFKGIGKILLCFAINYIKTELKLDIDDKSFKLSAQGGLMCDNMIGVYPYPMETVMKYYEKYYIDDFDIMFYVDSNNIKVLRKGYCMLENEKKLIKYYASLGFRVYSKDNQVLEINEENINKNIELRLYNYENAFVALRMIGKVSDIYKECFAKNEK